MKDIVTNLASLAYLDIVSLVKRLYSRQRRLENELRTLAAQQHKRHAHVSENWEDCYFGPCQRVRDLLRETIHADEAAE